jgi:hypothetical protein
MWVLGNIAQRKIVMETGNDLEEINNKDDGPRNA